MPGDVDRFLRLNRFLQLNGFLDDSNSFVLAAAEDHRHPCSVSVWGRRSFFGEACSEAIRTPLLLLFLVLNPADPDSRYNKHRGTGYLVQIMETYDEDDSKEAESAGTPKPDLITDVAVEPLTMHGKDALTPAFDDTQQRRIKP